MANGDMMQLNRLAAEIVRQAEADAGRLRVGVHQLENGAKLIDFGIDCEGGLQAGLELARICTSGLAEVRLDPGALSVGPWVDVVVATDHPLAACMASQYAGWQINPDGYFAMGSGPMRAMARVEPLFEKLDYTDAADIAVGVLESAKLPTADVSAWLADRCGVPPSSVQLCVAPTSSQAGTIQIVARSVETSLHKLMDLGFDLHAVRSGMGAAPLPPVAADDLTGIGCTNDSILYGARVTLWLHGDDESLAQLVTQIPSNASSDFGEPFGRVFARYDHDFYKIDPHLFSPAVVTLINLDTGRVHVAGEVREDILRDSFLGSN